jgi:hypothetical protein
MLSFTLIYIVKLNLIQYELERHSVTVLRKCKPTGRTYYLSDRRCCIYKLLPQSRTDYNIFMSD